MFLIYKKLTVVSLFKFFIIRKMRLTLPCYFLTFNNSDRSFSVAVKLSCIAIWTLSTFRCVTKDIVYSTFTDGFFVQFSL